MIKQKVIAIDGPSGSGKSTIAKKLATKLDFTYLDTGALYRSIAWALNNGNITEDDDASIQEFLDNMELKYAPNDSILVLLNGTDLTQEIRKHEVSKLASHYSKNKVIRNHLKIIQRDIASTRPSVLEGRDIGTIIFPDAALKIFLTADPLVRASRRFEQLKEMGQDLSGTTVEKIAQDISTRDAEDANRKNAPLVKAHDALEVDTSNLSIDQVIKKIEDIYQERLNYFR